MLSKRLAPSILSADFAHLARDIAKVSAANWLHIDVMDGHFVPNLTIGVPVIQSLSKVTDLPLDVHLMIANPCRYIDAYLTAGAGLLNLHIETETPQALQDALKKIRAAGAKAALTLKPATPVEALAPFVPLLDMVLLMTVEPGFGGQSFLAGSLQKIAQTRAFLDRHNPACELEVDGGISLDNVADVARAGANVFVAGNAVFGATDVPARVDAFQKILAAL